VSLFVTDGFGVRSALAAIGLTAAGYLFGMGRLIAWLAESAEKAVR
jgi:hypothetical protein